MRTVAGIEQGRIGGQARIPTALHARSWCGAFAERLVMLSFSALLLAMVPLGAAAQARIEPTETCFFGKLRPETPALEMTCGYVVVPENHGNPDGREVKLGFARLPARSASGKAPLMLLAGGPGGTLLKPETLLLMSDEFLGPLLDDRDIVILEERGAPNSVPSLVCPAMHRLPWTANQRGLDRAGILTLSTEILADCVAQGRAHGIDFAQYNSVAIAADVEAARQAFGYDKIVFYGTSYGAQLGQIMLLDYPDSLEAAILDGSAALGAKSWIEGRPGYVDAGIAGLQKMCAADAVCAKHYDIPKLLDRAFAMFDAGPIHASYTAPADPSVTVDMQLDDRDLAAAVFQLQTGQIFIRVLPSALNMMVADGRDSMALVLGQLTGEKIVEARTAASGDVVPLMHGAVVCSDDPVTSADDLHVADDASVYAKAFGAMIVDEYLPLCGELDVPAIPDSYDVEPTANVPVLILAGVLDVRTPLTRSEEVAAALPNARLVVFPEGTHVQLGEANRCAAEIVRAFVSNGEVAESDLKCLSNTPPLGFVLPDNTISTEGGKVEQ